MKSKPPSAVCKGSPPCTDEIGEKGMVNMTEPTLKVCEHCLMAIESREGTLPTLKHYIDSDDTDAKCDWCEETEIDVLYEILG